MIIMTEDLTDCNNNIIELDKDTRDGEGNGPPPQLCLVEALSWNTHVGLNRQVNPDEDHTAEVDPELGARNIFLNIFLNQVNHREDCFMEVDDVAKVGVKKISIYEIPILQALQRIEALRTRKHRKAVPRVHTLTRNLMKIKPCKRNSNKRKERQHGFKANQRKHHEEAKLILPSSKAIKKRPRAVPREHTLVHLVDYLKAGKLMKRRCRTYLQQHHEEENLTSRAALNEDEGLQFRHKLLFIDEFITYHPIYNTTNAINANITTKILNKTPISNSDTVKLINITDFTYCFNTKLGITTEFKSGFNTEFSTNADITKHRNSKFNNINNFSQ